MGFVGQLRYIAIYYVGELVSFFPHTVPTGESLLALFILFLFCGTQGFPHHGICPPIPPHLCRSYSSPHPVVPRNITSPIPPFIIILVRGKKDICSGCAAASSRGLVHSAHRSGRPGLNIHRLYSTLIIRSPRYLYRIYIPSYDEIPLYHVIRASLYPPTYPNRDR